MKYLRSVLLNLLLAYLVYMVCRVAYVWENWSLFSAGWQALSWGELIKGSLRFDTSAILYTNALYVLLMFLPLHCKERRWWHQVCKWLFVVVNSFCMATNLADAVYSQYTGRRTTFSFFQEFSNEGNLGSIVGVELLNHWYLVLLGIALILLMVFLYQKPCELSPTPSLRYYLIQSLSFLLFIPLAICGMRGGATTAIRPITVSNANQYVNQPAEAAIVLNTPFSVIRTIGKKSFQDPQYFTPGELDQIFSPVHLPTEGGEPNKSQVSSLKSQVHKNIVVLIVESFGREYIGAYNRTLEQGTYQGYTPFVDSLMAHSLTFEHTFANGRKSIDGMPSILSSIPMFEEPFFLTPYSLNRVSGIAGELSQVGYHTAFFHGAENGSMGFQAFARTTGFEHYYGRTEYNQDARFDGNRDFDGTWAIWDEPFLQYYALQMSEMPEPFMTAVFTASSHHPFVIPEAYQNVYPEEGLPMHKCIRYTDNALRKFFDTARRQPWYRNTLFVITADHTNQSDHPEYGTSLGLYCAPIIFFDPSGQLPTGVWPSIAQQIDIMPTLLNLVGYPNPYVAFGIDLLGTPPDSTWAVNFNNGIYQYVFDGELLQFDGQRTVGRYNLRSDWMLQHNLNDPLSPRQQQMEQHLKAIIQSYMQRMTTNRLIP